MARPGHLAMRWLQPGFRSHAGGSDKPPIHSHRRDPGKPHTSGGHIRQPQEALLAEGLSTALRNAARRFDMCT